MVCTERTWLWWRVGSHVGRMDTLEDEAEVTSSRVAPFLPISRPARVPSQWN